jgi:hypothetical protein
VAEIIATTGLAERSGSMRRMLWALLILTLTTGVAHAQGADATSTPNVLPVVSFSSDWSSGSSTSETGRSFKDGYDWKLGAMWAALSTSTALDTWSTFEVQSRCPSTCAERDMFAKWAINKGPSVAYPTAFAFDAGVIAFSAWLRESNNPHLRQIWWLVPVAATAFHVLAFEGNRGTLDELQRYPWRAR